MKWIALVVAGVLVLAAPIKAHALPGVPGICAGVWKFIDDLTDREPPKLRLAASRGKVGQGPELRVAAPVSGPRKAAEKK